jgi:epsilon-lactone hydrolase
MPRGAGRENGVPMRILKPAVLATALAATSATALPRLTAQERPVRRASEVVVSDDGTVRVPAMDVPLSDLLSPEAKAYVTQHLKDMQNPAAVAQVDGVPRFMRGYIERQKILYAVNRADTRIAGVHVYDYTPKDGVATARRVLINLHGGGFSGCWPACAELESIPIAALARIRVVSVDYRQGPTYRFPAASEDVAAVYTQLLKDYAPQDVGIYGCSAGGLLTAMAVTWFEAHKLPRPGAVGILCSGAGTPSGAGFGGDATYTTAAIGEGRGAPPLTRSGGRGEGGGGLGYLAGTSAADPLVAPINSPAALGKFPPTLIVTATRGFELSGAVYTHAQLVKHGVDAELHVWDGLFHGFFYNPDVPESRDCYDVIVKFFNRHLRRS